MQAILWGGGQVHAQPAFPILATEVPGILHPRARLGLKFFEPGIAFRMVDRKSTFELSFRTTRLFASLRERRYRARWWRNAGLRLARRDHDQKEGGAGNSCIRRFR